jgi:sugar phosphate permease
MHPARVRLPAFHKNTGSGKEGSVMRGTRLIVMSVIWFASFFLILDRVNISLAAPRIMSELTFDATQMGFILSIYYWGYLLGHFSSGLITQS